MASGARLVMRVGDAAVNGDNRPMIGEHSVRVELAANEPVYVPFGDCALLVSASAISRKAAARMRSTRRPASRWVSNWMPVQCASKN